MVLHAYLIHDRSLTMLLMLTFLYTFFLFTMGMQITSGEGGGYHGDILGISLAVFLSSKIEL